MEQKEKEQARKSKEQLSIWFTNISHEFRTPLTIIQGLLDQIKEQPTFHLQKRLNIIKRNAHSLDTLVTQLLDLSRLESGVLAVQKEQDNIIKYIGYLTESFHSLAFEKKISLSFYSKLESQNMWYDAEKVKKILCNILFNALKFTPEYGKVIVIAEVVSAEKTKEWIQRTTSYEQVLIGTIQPISSYLQIIVKDSGVGMNAEQLPLIFDRFFQVAPLNQQTEGSGIGLSLTKELIELLGGMLHVESSTKRGSTFSIFLPMEQGTNLEQMAVAKEKTVFPIKDTRLTSDRIIKHPVTNKATKKPLLLIVEDNADVIYYIKSCTQDTYTILEAKNGKEGMEQALEALPDIIISDVIMPIMDGYALCKALKKDIRTSHIPFLLLTAKSTQADKYQGLEVGAFAYLTKPFEKEELLIRLQNLLLWKQQLRNYLKMEASNKRQHLPPTNSDLELKFIQDLDEKIGWTTNCTYTFLFFHHKPSNYWVL